MCFIKPGFLNLFSYFVQHNDYNLGINFSNGTDLKEFYQWMDWSGLTVLTNGKFP